LIDCLLSLRALDFDCSWCCYTRALCYLTIPHRYCSDVSQVLPHNTYPTLVSIVRQHSSQHSRLMFSKYVHNTARPCLPCRKVVDNNLMSRLGAYKTPSSSPFHPSSNLYLFCSTSKTIAEKVVFLFSPA
jgi:hypothetical protein